jgi:hypothetical protein
MLARMTWTDPRTGVTTAHPDGPNWQYPAPFRPDPAPEIAAAAPGISRRVTVLAVILAIVGVLVGFVVTAAIVSDDNKTASPPPPAAAPTPTLPVLPGAAPTTVPSRGNTAANDPHANVLDQLVVQQSDVPEIDTVDTVPNGNTLDDATLDLCNGTFPSEAGRTARRQVEVFDSLGNAPFSTEAVLYGHAATGAQAFSELQRVVKDCPSTPVVSPIGEPTAVTLFGPNPDNGWDHTTGVERLAYDVTTTRDSGDSTHAVVVYLRRGRALMGLYFNQPDGTQVAVNGETTIQDIVRVFEQRMAAVPSTVVNAP